MKARGNISRMEESSERISANKKVQTRVKDLMGRMQALENVCKESKADTRLQQANIQDLFNQIKDLQEQLAEKSSLDIHYPGQGYEAYNVPTSSSSNLTYLLARIIQLKRETDDGSSASCRKKRRSNWDILNASQRDYSKISSFAEVAAKKSRCDSQKEAQAKESTQAQSTESQKPSTSHVKKSDSFNELDNSGASKSKKRSKTESRKDSFSSKNQRVEDGKKVSEDLRVCEGNRIARKSQSKSAPETSTASHSPEEFQLGEVKEESPKDSQPEEVKQRTPKECRICLKSFPSKKALRLHNEDKHLAVKCLKCDTVIASSIRDNPGNSDYCFQCQQDEKSSRAAETEDISSEEPEECFDCPICQKTYKSEKRLAKHLAKHN